MDNKYIVRVQYQLSENTREWSYDCLTEALAKYRALLNFHNDIYYCRVIWGNTIIEERIFDKW